MVQRRISNQSDDEDIIDIDFDDKSAQVEDERDQIDEILSAIDKSEDDVTFSISVSRHTGTRAGGAWCFDCTPEEFKTVRERLLEEHGPGTYLARLKRNGKFFKKLIIGIDKPQIPRGAMHQKSQITEIADAIKVNQNQIAAIATGNAPQNNDNSMIATFMQMMQFQSQQSTELIKALLLREQPQARGIGDDLKSVAAILELSQQMSGGEREGRGMIDIVDSFLKSPMAERLGDQIASAIPPQIGAPASGATTPAQLASPAQPAQRAQTNPLARPAQESVAPAPPAGHPLVDSLDPQLKAQLTGMLSFWVQRAKGESPPDLYAHVALDTIDTAMIGAFLLRDDLQNIAAVLLPETQLHWPWISELIAEIKTLIEEDVAAPEVAPAAPASPEPPLTPSPVASDNTQHVSPPDNPKPAAANADGNTERQSGNESDAKNNGRARKTRKAKPAGAAKGD